MRPANPTDLSTINQNVDTEVIFEDVTDPSKKVKRTGFCNRCGVCCVDTDNIFQTIDGDYNPISEPLPQVVPGMCAYFRWTPEGLGECTGRDTKYYKGGCMMWPSEPDHMIYESCGYKFEIVVE